MTETFEGWADQIRIKGKLAFIDMYLGGKTSHKIQVVVSGNKAEIKQLTLSRHCALRVVGTKVSSIGEGQKEEVQTTPSQVTVVGHCDQERYPIAKADLTVDYLRTIPMWRGRTKLFRSVFHISDLVKRGIHSYFKHMEYIHVHTPLITKSDCEGAGSIFTVTARGCDEFFGTSVDGTPVSAYLTVSGQLQGEVLAASLGPIYTMGPTFRAERSSTSRHLSEFLMMEPEVPFANLQDIIKISIDMLKHIVRYCMDNGYSSLEILEENSPGLLNKLEQFLIDSPVIMTYTEAVKKVKSSRLFEGVEWGVDLGSEHETWLCEVMGNKLLILTDYPSEIKAFYMYENPDKKTVACMDVLIPGIGEIIGGSQRESRSEILEPKMKKLGLDGSEYDFYRDLRKFGYAGSSGFGLGVERMIRFVTGIKQIRDVIPFPVAYGKLFT